jgi:hypothetical protein
MKIMLRIAFKEKKKQTKKKNIHNEEKNRKHR